MFKLRAVPSSFRVQRIRNKTFRFSILDKRVMKSKLWKSVEIENARIFYLNQNE